MFTFASVQMLFPSLVFLVVLVSSDVDPEFRPWIMDLPTHAMSVCALTPLYDDNDLKLMRVCRTDFALCFRCGRAVRAS